MKGEYKMEKKFEVRMYVDVDDQKQGTVIIEVSQLRDYDTLVRIINFLECLRE